MAVLSYFVKRYRGAIAAVGIGVRSNVSQPDSATATITSGGGAPTASAPNGSVYLRQDAPDADNAMYMRIGDAWVALRGATA